MFQVRSIQMQKYKIRKYLKSCELRLFLIFMMPFVGLFFFFSLSEWRMNKQDDRIGRLSGRRLPTIADYLIAVWIYLLACYRKALQSHLKLEIFQIVDLPLLKIVCYSTFRSVFPLQRCLRHQRVLKRGRCQSFS